MTNPKSRVQLALEPPPVEVIDALEANADCAHCGRSFHAHCFERGADCGEYSPIIETTGEAAE